MAKTKGKRMKSIRHRATTPKMNSKKKNEPTKGRSSNKGKRITRSPSPTPSPNITPWFSKEHYEASYMYNYAKKDFIQPKFLNLEWLKTQGFVFPKLLEYHGLKKHMEMKGTFYPELVRVFYTTTILMVRLVSCVLR